MTSKLAVLAMPSFAFLLALPGAARAADTTKINGRVVIPVDDDEAVFDGDALGDATIKGGIGLSHAPTGRLRERLIRATRSGAFARIAPLSGREGRGTGEGRDDRRNVQINDPALDHIVTFDPAVVATRPFEFATQSETSGVRDGRHVVVGYNSSANATVQFFPGSPGQPGVLAFTKLMFSAFSVSHDGGRSWTSGFVPAVSDDAPFTFGDPALAIDRRGNIFYASLGTDAAGEHGTLIINKSTDHGSSFGTATVVAVDDGSDKEWLAIGADPTAPSRDNIYVTWTSFITQVINGRPQTVASELWLARSTDGGTTFSSKRLFAPAGDARNSSFIQFSNPVVDASTGRLYIPFLHFTNEDADNVRVLVSDDGGITFSFLRFNVSGAVDAFAFPNVTPGLLNDCTGGGVRNALVAGADQGGSRGLPVFKQATRLIAQPAAAASRGTFLFALNASTSPFFGDPTAGSEIKLVVSRNGGRTFASAVRVAGSTAADPQHVHPAVSLSRDAESLLVTYYVQQADQRLRTDVARLELDDDRVRLEKSGPLSSTAFDLTPSNIVRVRTPTSTTTTNFDRTIVSCYDIGEYQTLARSRNGDDVTAAWGDNRQSWTSPPGSPGAGTHAQPDVFATTPDD
ncbi:MAG TPA: sialidase family protein [Myxococcales bacterium]|nr:sialidase family protein [Myxococcales bacterium]